MEIDPIKQLFIKAQYKGPDGFGYTKGNVYTLALYELEVRTAKTISIYPMYPNQEGGMGMNYISFLDFLRSWDKIEQLALEKLKMITPV